jgi:hypothetical protein
MTDKKGETAPMEKGLKKRDWKKPIGFVLAFVLFLSICGVFFSLDLWLGFLNKQTVVTAVAKSEYSARAYEQLREDMEALMKNHMLDSEPALALLDENQFYTDSDNSLKATLNGQRDRIDTAGLKGDLKKEIYDQLTADGVPVTAEIATAVDEIAFTGANLYDNHTYFQFGEEFMKAKILTLPTVILMLIVSATTAALLALVIGLAYRRRRAAMSLIGYSLFAAVIANFLVMALLFVTNPIGQTAAAAYYQNFINHYLETSLVPAIGLSCLGLIICAVLWTTIRRSRREG